MKAFGKRLRTLGKRLRTLRLERHPDLSMRQLARKAGIEPGYLSKIERGVERASEDTIVLLADALGESRDVLLAMDGRMSKRLLAIVIKRPDLLASWIEAVEKMPDDAVLRVVREVRDGKW